MLRTVARRAVVFLRQPFGLKASCRRFVGISFRHAYCSLKGQHQGVRRRFGVAGGDSLAVKENGHG